MPNATVCLCFDFDAVSGWIHGHGATNSPVKLSRGRYGAAVAAPRILDLLDRLDVPATWFTPGHTIESFPEICGEVHDRGHDIQHHGWHHTPPAKFADREGERADFERSIETIRDLTGEKPTGYRSPSWDFSAHTLDILQELDFEWDSSLMGHDFEPYRVRELPIADPEEPYVAGEETDLLEFPVSWHRDDWPSLQFTPGRSGRPRADEEAVFDGWYEQFDWMYENVEDGVFTLTMHPQVTGQPPRLRYLEAFVESVRAKQDVEFALLNDVARRIL
ncbi:MULTISPECIES: polysaccharide deacetylase [unclassified Haladaptatus]|uniref:polysaccharide deacetylase family protein n=1 Tax=unclassified Haladaptatus TaxID=2622732 RepID=UPI00209C01C3|nr:MULTISPECIES: polysaccharide deacetylase [unclassified Haladaptatus]MCO8243294.1 polysaccharide deacetylase [Haladaptatus sp. AB643]MCO8253005.1 polysaccharide deacetylase [Haladaptatus sp. AB618]